MALSLVIIDGGGRQELESWEVALEAGGSLLSALNLILCDIVLKKSDTSFTHHSLFADFK